MSDSARTVLLISSAPPVRRRPCGRGVVCRLPSSTASRLISGLVAPKPSTMILISIKVRRSFCRSLEERVADACNRSGVHLVSAC